jgi:tRNA A37 threonylcarbamoyladenosine modification protein TsaB|tara:strand:- start:770 stop:1423 length:654 start_codon:yes stop_codon:yes gene_type:complete
MVNKLNNLEMGIDSSLSYCSITLFKKKKIIWNKGQSCEFGHEKVLSNLLRQMVKQTHVLPENISFLHLNKGPARFTAIRNCHALAKGYFINHSVKIFSYSIFEHFFLGLSRKVKKDILCIVDTNRRDLAIQKINPNGKLIGKTRTMLIDNDLVHLLKDDYLLIGNGVNKLSKKKEFKFIKNRVIGPVKLESNYFINRIFDKKGNNRFPKIIYPYSPI